MDCWSRTQFINFLMTRKDWMKILFFLWNTTVLIHHKSIKNNSSSVKKMFYRITIVTKKNIFVHEFCFFIKNEAKKKTLLRRLSSIMKYHGFKAFGTFRMYVSWLPWSVLRYLLKTPTDQPGRLYVFVPPGCSCSTSIP